MGILPQETARAADAPPLSAIATPPVLLGSLDRPLLAAAMPGAEIPSHGPGYRTTMN
jgi:hypothetical protein